MFDCLRAANNRGVENNFILYLPSKPVRFLDEAVYTGTARSLWMLPESLESNIETVELIFSFVKMVEQTCGQVLVGSFFDHFWQGFNDLMFGVVNVSHSMKEEIINGFDVFCEYMCFS